MNTVQKVYRWFRYFPDWALSGIAAVFFSLAAFRAPSNTDGTFWFLLSVGFFIFGIVRMFDRHLDP